MNKDIKILVADDHPMLLKGLKDELISSNYQGVLTANNGAEALEKIVSERPDIAILDIEMPLLTGFEVINKCLEEGIKTKFIVLTSHKENRYIYKAKSLNISGYLLKDEPFSEIQNCIEQIAKNETYFSSTFNSVFENEISPEIEKLKLLSPSERTIVRMIADGKSSKEMAESLLISVRTIQKHRTNIIQKLNLSSDQDALNNWVISNKSILSSI
ncbi:response regulator transcription factor [Winogradskyella jejuensis]|uniref:Two component transcriptional regulator, LuxR family n=1 Tax=Winogradskyella jejuensis TaxID=1089305 RepID=A0A1M5URX4_9FLAO|nr:response regulator transcription factor [Winogradskyella jejuensis]SHH65463.1 two component transcriptional regulator, LuxR family [Winogradskyella jejuensis]